MLLTAVVDESGKFKDKDVICLAGIIGGPHFWRGLTGKWVQTLQKHSIDYLHIKELRRWDGVYASKKMEWGDAKREEVLVEFAKILPEVIREHGGVALCVSLDARAYRDLKSEQQRIIGKPDLAVFNFFIASMLWLAASLLPEGFEINITCDDDEAVAEPVYKLLRLAKVRNPLARRIKALCFCDDEVYPPLQIADLVANTLFREATRVVNSPDNPRSEMFRALAGSGVQIHLVHLSADVLTKIAASPGGITISFAVKIVSEVDNAI
jgi:hypothetical protein